MLASLVLGLLALLPAGVTALTTVAVLEPVGGEVWSAGVAHALVWDLATDSNNDIDVEYLVDGVPTLIERRLFVLPGTYTTAWTPPPQDLGNVTVRVCATDAVPVECATSPAFAIDGTVPTVTARSPEGTNVALLDPIDVHFSETMNRTRFEASITVIPDPGNLTFVKIAANGTRVDHTAFEPGTTYVVTLGCGATDESVPGNAVEGCPVSWTFRTATPPAIEFTSPIGGEVWSGGSVHEIRWTATDAEDPASALSVHLESSTDGTAWAPIAGPLPADAPYLWTVPAEDSGAARLRAVARDTRALNTTTTSAAFAIDATLPRVTATIPANASVGASWTDALVVEFSEPVMGPLDSGEFGLRDGAGRWIEGSLAWDSPNRFRFTPAMPLRAFAAYTARVNRTLHDGSDPGNRMAGPYEWRFATRANHAPTVDLAFAPDPVLSGGSTWTVSWSASDPEDDAAPLAVYLEFSGGGAFTRVAGPLPETGSFLWTVPGFDASSAALLVRVIDGQGGEATDAVLFAIDGTPPSLLAASPGIGETDVAPDAELVLTFSEPLRFVSGFVGLRDAATLSWTDVVAWWDDATTLRVRPLGLLREMVSYEVVVNDTATDRSSPGNRLAAMSWAFRVAAFPPILAVIEPPPDARWTAGASQTIRIQVADARDPSVTISAALALDGVTFAPFLAERSVANGLAAFPVAAPTADAPNAILRICAADAAGAEACVTVRLGIDATRPRVVQSVPASGAKQVLPDAPILLTFSESMDPAAVETSFALSPPTPVTFRWARKFAANDTVFMDHPRLLELRTYTASLACPAKDASTPGLPIAGACPVLWTFTTAATPEVHLLYPIGGERLTGGAVQPIRWIAAEEEGAVRVSVDLSVDGGATFSVPLVSRELFGVGDTRTERALPSVNAADAVLRVTATDTLGLTRVTTSGPFSIDAAPPMLLSTSPPEGAIDVSPLLDLVLTFSESMDAATTYALGITPPLRDAVLTWSTTFVPIDTLRIQHSAIRLGTAVAVSLDGLRDASRPGNAMSGTITFTIRPDLERPRAEILVDAEATAGDIVVLDASASSDNDEIVEYAWTVRDGTGRAVGRMKGDRVEYRAARAGVFNVTVAVLDAAGNRGEAFAPLLVHTLGTTVAATPPPAGPVLGWLALGGGGATAYGLTDRGRSFLTRMLILPFYARLRPAAAADQETRGMIRGYVLVHPGDSYSDIKRNLRLSNGCLAYHLAVLEERGIIQSVKKGSRHMYYPADVPIPVDGGGLHEVQDRLLRNIEELPGMSMKDLAGLIGISRQLTLYHVRKLAGDGLVRLARHGMNLRAFPTTERERAQLLDRFDT